MLLPHNDKIARYLLTQSPLLGVVRGGGVYRLACLDDLRIDPVSLDIHGEHWSLSFEDFIEEVKIFNHEVSSHILAFYPQSQSQQMLATAFMEANEIRNDQMGEIVRMLKPIQHGKIEKNEE